MRIVTKKNEPGPCCAMAGNRNSLVCGDAPVSLLNHLGNELANLLRDKRKRDQAILLAVVLAMLMTCAAMLGSINEDKFPKNNTDNAIGTEMIKKPKFIRHR